MPSCYQQCRWFSNVSLAMFAIGMVLPFAIAFMGLSIRLSPATYNFFQFSGAIGAVVFYVGQRMSRPADASPTTVPATAEPTAAA
jgi:hypothetical protein